MLENPSVRPGICLACIRADAPRGTPCLADHLKPTLVKVTEEGLAPTSVVGRV